MSGIIFAIGESLRGFTRRWFITFLTITTVSVGLAVFALFLFLTLNFQIWFERIGGRIDLELYIDETINNDAYMELINRVKQIDGIEDVEYISSDEAKRRYIENFGKEIFEGLDFNPLPPSLRIKLKKGEENPQNIKELSEKLSQIPGVKDISIEMRIIRRIHNMLRLFWIIVIVGGAILFTAVVLIIVNTIKLAIFSRREEIELMRLIGATKAFIRRPFLFEGIIQGLIAGIVAGGFVRLLAWALEKLFPGTIQNLDTIPIIIVILGGLLGGIGSILALKRFLMISL